MVCHRHRLHDRQAQPDAVRIDAAQAVEALERSGMLARRDARAGIVEAQQDALIDAGTADLDEAAGGREADGVVQQVVHQHVQAQFQGRQPGRVEARDNRHPAVGGHRAQLGHHVLEDLVQVHIDRRVPRDRQAVDAGQIEQLIQKVAGLVDPGHQPAQARRQLLRR
jgi:hypothetical protein